MTALQVLQVHLPAVPDSPWVSCRRPSCVRGAPRTHTAAGPKGEVGSPICVQGQRVPRVKWGVPAVCRGRPLHSGKKGERRKAAKSSGLAATRGGCSGRAGGRLRPEVQGRLRGIVESRAHVAHAPPHAPRGRRRSAAPRHSAAVNGVEGGVPEEGDRVAFEWKMDEGELYFHE